LEENQKGFTTLREISILQNIQEKDRVTNRQPYLPLVKATPFTVPKVDAATKRGIIQLTGPR